MTAAHAEVPPKVSDALNLVLRTLNLSGTGVVRSAGITQAQSTMLRVLDRGGRISASELAVEVGLSSPAVSSALDFLERRELVRRVHDEEDRRRVWIEITRKGRTLWARCLRRFHELHTRVNALVPPTRAPVFIETLQIIAREMGARETWIQQRCPLCHPAPGRGGRV
jgi:DNA-binding MarR family transcriptional regulator